MMNAVRLTTTRLSTPAVIGAFTLYASSDNHHNLTVYTEEALNTKILHKEIVDLIEDDAEKRGDGTSLAGTFIRLAWHCCGTYDARTDTGGSSGARMRFIPESAYGNNAGLDIARNALEPLKLKFPGLSYADLYTYAGAVAVESSGGPKIPFRFGRVDEFDGKLSGKDDNLPHADKGSLKNTLNHVRDVFGRMNFTDEEIVALLGAHSMGRCHTDASGYWGPWTNSETTFSNEYFRLLLEERWSPKTTHNGKPWTGPDQYEDQSGQLMMLPSDIVLLTDPQLKKWVEVFSKDETKFFKAFSKAFAKLLELGVHFPHANKPWYQFW